MQKFDNFLLKTANKYANFRWYASPLGKKAKANKDEYLKIWEIAKKEEYKLIDDFENKTISLKYSFNTSCKQQSCEI